MVIKQHFCTFGRNDRYRPRSLCPSTWSLGSHVNPCPPESAPVPTWVPWRRVPFSAAQSRPPRPPPRPPRPFSPRPSLSVCLTSCATCFQTPLLLPGARVWDPTASHHLLWSRRFPSLLAGPSASVLHPPTSVLNLASHVTPLKYMSRHDTPQCHGRHFPVTFCLTGRKNSGHPRPVSLRLGLRVLAIRRRGTSQELHRCVRPIPGPLPGRRFLRRTRDRSFFPSALRPKMPPQRGVCGPPSLSSALQPHPPAPPPAPLPQPPSLSDPEGGDVCLSALLTSAVHHLTHRLGHSRHSVTIS